MVQSRLVPIHISPRLCGKEKGSRPARRRPGVQDPGWNRLRVLPPAPPAGISPTAAAGAAASTSENSRRRGPPGDPPIRCSLVADTPRARPFLPRRNLIGCAVRSSGASTLCGSPPPTLRATGGVPLGNRRKSTRKSPVWVYLEFGERGPANLEGKARPALHRHLSSSGM